MDKVKAFCNSILTEMDKEREFVQHDLDEDFLRQNLHSDKFLLQMFQLGVHHKYQVCGRLVPVLPSCEDWKGCGVGGGIKNSKLEKHNNISAVTYQLGLYAQ